MAGLPTIARCSVIDRDNKSCNAESSSTYDRTTGVTSLPELPQYPRPLKECSTWGEDPTIDALDTHRDRRNHFYSCHPVPDVDTKYEGYKFSKAMDKDASVFHSHAHSTVRHVYRPPRPAVFPNNNHVRTLPDGKYFLSENTRAALAKSVSNLYCTSRNSSIYKDMTEHMVAREQRTAGYRVACGDEEAEPTCCRVFNHPDPCPFCWNGGTKKHFMEELRQFQAMLPDINKRSCSGDAKVPCSRCHDRRCPHKHHCRPAPPAPPSKPQNDAASDGPSADASSNTGDTDPDTAAASTSQQSPPEDACQGDGSHNEGFGPWTYEHRLGETEEKYLLRDVYYYKMPGGLHCNNTQNEHNTPFDVRTSSKTYSNLPPVQYLQHWTSRCREEGRLPATNSLGAVPSIGAMPRIGAATAGQAPDSTAAGAPRNSWTNRDGNNLRVPCMSDVIGSRHKTDTHNRFFAEYVEPVPDPRDWVRYSKRVNFGGYNSAVFR